MKSVQGLPYILFLIRAAGPVGAAHARAYARMLREEGHGAAAERVERAIKNPMTHSERVALMESNDLEPS